jgi:hypothetical protein
MKAVPMKGRLGSKRIRGFLWAGKGAKWTKKENYFQLEDNELVTAVLSTNSGAFWIRCSGAACEVTTKNAKHRILGTTIVALPRAKIR